MKSMLSKGVRQAYLHRRTRTAGQFSAGIGLRRDWGDLGLGFVGVDVDDDLEDVFHTVEYRVSDGVGDHVAVDHGNPGIDDDVDLDVQFAGVLARLEVVRVANALDRFGHSLDFVEAGLLGRGVGGGLEGGDNDVEADLDNESGDQQGGERIEEDQRRMDERTADAEGRGDRAEGIGAVVPGVGDENVALDPPPDAHGVLIHPFLDGDGDQRADQGDVGRALQGPCHHRSGGCVPDPDAHRDQREADQQRHQRLDLAVAEGVVLVLALLGVLEAGEGQDVGGEIGEAVDCVGDQRLRAPHDAQEGLGDDQQGVADYAEPECYAAGP